MSKRIAVIGSGGAGLGAAWLASEVADVTLFEADPIVGGNSRTVPFPCADGITRPVDMGVVLTDPWTYPVLYAMTKLFQIETRASGWSIGASFRDEAWWTGGPETELFARLRSQASRFEVDAYRIHSMPIEQQLRTVQSWLDELGYDQEFAAKMLSPVLTLLVVTRAGLTQAPIANILGLFADKQLSFFNATNWRLFPKGTASYVEPLATAIAARGTIKTSTPVLEVRRNRASNQGAVTVRTHEGEAFFDDVIFATQAWVTRSILSDPTPEESRILGLFDSQEAELYCHSDSSVLSKVLPQDLCSQYHYDGPNPQPDLQGSFTLNVGVGLGFPAAAGPALVTGYNVGSTLPRPDPAKVVAKANWKHELGTMGAIEGRTAYHTIQGNGGTWHCGTTTVWASADAVITSGMVVAARPELGGTFPFADDPAALADFQQIQGVMFPGQMAEATHVRPHLRRTT